MRRKTVLVVLGIAVCAAGVARSASGDVAEEGIPAGANWYLHERESDVTDEGKPVHIAAKVAAYLPNRLGDLFDIFSLQVGVGFGAHVNVHGTRALQVGLGAATGSRIGFDRGQVGVVNESRSEFSLLPINIESFQRTTAGSNFRPYKTSEDLPWRDKKFRDYWGIGAEVTAGIPSVRFEFHPTEIPDFLLGLFGFDFRHDDIPRKAHVKRISLSKNRRMVDRVKRVVIVPSRVVQSRDTRMSVSEGVGVYQSRYSSEFTAGLLGTELAKGSDRRAAGDLTEHGKNVDFDMLTRLLGDTERTVAVDLEWEVVEDIEKTKGLFENPKMRVEKRNEDMSYLRLPNYPGMAKFYGADAVLDVRLWEWGVWRQTLSDNDVVALAVQYRLIKFPENVVLFDWLVVSRDLEKQSGPLAGEGGNPAEFVKESKEVCDVVSAKLRDLICEK